MPDTMLRNRLRELSDRCENAGIYTYTEFLGLNEIAEFREMEHSLCPCMLYGGMTGAERVIARFGTEEMLGYREQFPIALLKLMPKSQKFAGQIEHRDVLGTIMSLGIRRSMIGDILLEETTAYVFCLDGIAPYLVENLTRIKHTDVTCSLSESLPDGLVRQAETIRLTVSSERADLIMAKLLHLSREKTKELFEAERVFIDGKTCLNAGKTLHEGNSVTVRGFGKFIFLGTEGKTKKGKDAVKLEVYGIHA